MQFNLKFELHFYFFKNNKNLYIKTIFVIDFEISFFIFIINI